MVFFKLATRSEPVRANEQILTGCLNSLWTALSHCTYKQWTYIEGGHTHTHAPRGTNLLVVITVEFLNGHADSSTHFNRNFGMIFLRIGAPGNAIVAITQRGYLLTSNLLPQSIEPLYERKKTIRYKRRELNERERPVDLHTTLVTYLPSNKYSYLSYLQQQQQLWNSGSSSPYHWQVT